MDKKRILIADDDAISRELVTIALQNAGYEVAVAKNDQEAVSLFASYQPNLVLTDLQMPRLDGAGLLSHIKHIAPDTPVILFTAHSDLGAEREAQRLGADDYLNKPLDLAEMLGRIARAVS